MLRKKDAMVTKRMVPTALAVLLAAAAVGGCTASSGPKPAKPAVDPNTYPADYRNQIVSFLVTELTDRADFHGALIAEPALKPVQQSQRYVACVEFNGHNEQKNKVAVFLAGEIAQFVDAKPEQCGGAAYQPFKELEDATPSK
ncbi:MAG TPA: hypothetical protein VGJ20_15770 [Xanthobacteraceae bacterium]